MKSPNLITQYGRALWGARFRADMARFLGEDERRVRRWVDGVYETPPEVLDRLRGLMVERMGLLRRYVGE